MEERTPGEQKETIPPAIQRTWASSRDIGELFRTQWPKYLVDIIVIILGITISFTFDSHKEEADRRATEQQYLVSLLSDMQADIAELKTGVIPRTESVVNATDTLLKFSTENFVPDERDFSTLIRAISSRPNFVSKNATFSDLKSSGNMQLITDIKLKAELFEYNRRYEALKTVETSERETSNIVLVPYLLKHFSVKMILVGGQSILMPGNTLKNVINDNEFNNVVAIRKVNRKELLHEYKEVLSLGESIVGQLQKEIR